MRINIIDLVCKTDKKGIPIGHEKKTILQTLQLTKEYNIKIYAHKSYLDEIQFNIKKKPLAFRSVFSEFRIAMYFKIILNYFIVFTIKKNEILWFTMIYEPIFWMLAFFPKRHKYIISTYCNWEKKFEGKTYQKKLRLKIYKKALNKIDLIISSNNNYTPLKNYVNLPDFYLEPKYEYLLKKEKKNRIVCLGIMGISRDLLGLVKALKGKKIELLITGYFEDETYYEKLKAFEDDYIHISNIILENDKYINLIASSKFVVLPYNVKLYKDKTSGILQETIALGSVPIAPQEILNINNIKGIGYITISEISQKMKEYDGKVKNDCSNFSFNKFKQTILNEINKLQ